MQPFAIKFAEEALQKYCTEQEIATFVKSQLEQQFGHDWNCIVGEKFGLAVTHEKGTLLYFTVGSVSVLVFQSV